MTSRRTVPPADAEQINADIASRIRARIEAANVSVTAIARKSGISRSQVHRIVHGERRANTHHLMALARAFGVTIEELLQSSTQEESRTSRSPAAQVAIASYLENHADDITPRERRLMENLRTRMAPGAVLSEDDIAQLLNVVREEFCSR